MTKPQDHQGSLGPIRGTTLTAPDLQAIEDAYTSLLGYRVVEKGTVSADTAQGWGAPAAAGRPLLILQPESGLPYYIRVVEQAVPQGYRPYRTHGWNAIEMIVKDPDALHERLKDSGAFTITGVPSGVDTYDYLWAMQASGPADEYLYFTRVHPPRPDLAVAQSFVDRCFIMTMAGPDLPAILDFYSGVFGNKASPIFQVGQPQMNDAFGLPRDQKHPLAVVTVGDGTKIETDQAPPEATARPLGAAGLTPGVALVSFECFDFDAHLDRMIAPPRVAALPPFAGSRVGVIRGAAGELIELVER